VGFEQHLKPRNFICLAQPCGQAAMYTVIVRGTNGVMLLCVIGSRYFFGGNLMKLKPTLAALFAAALITSPVLAQTPAPVAAPAPAGAAAAGAGAVGGVATTTLVLGAVAAAVVVSAIAGDGTVATVATQ
jgi:hypothetical protein